MRGKLLLIAGFCAAVPAGRLQAQAPHARGSGQPVPSAVTGPVLATEPRLIASIRRIIDRSPTFRDALEHVAGLGRHIVILTPGQLHRQAGEPTNRSAFDESQIAESVFVPEPDSVIRTVVVVLNLSLLDRVQTALQLRDHELDEDIDRILIHEVYAHAVPLLTDGRSAVCRDPSPDEQAEDACSIRRENRIREEAGLGRRTDYGLASLTIGRRMRR